MSILPSLYHLLLITYKNRRYRRKVPIHRNRMKIRSFLMILTFWRLLVLTLNQILATCRLLSALKSIFSWHALAATVLILGQLLLADHVVRMHLKWSRAQRRLMMWVWDLVHCTSCALHELILSRLEIACIRYGNTITFKHLVNSTSSLVPSNVGVVQLKLQISLLLLLLLILFSGGWVIWFWYHVFLNVLNVIV